MVSWYYIVLSEVGGVSPTGKSAFVFVRAMRACERAKLCVGALDSDSPPARSGELKMSSGTFGLLLTVAGVLRNWR